MSDPTAVGHPKCHPARRVLVPLRDEVVSELRVILLEPARDDPFTKTSCWGSTTGVDRRRSSTDHQFVGGQFWATQLVPESWLFDWLATQPAPPQGVPPAPVQSAVS